MTEICSIGRKVAKSSSLFVVVVEGLKFGGDPKSFPLKSVLSLFKPLCHSLPRDIYSILKKKTRNHSMVLPSYIAFHCKSSESCVKCFLSPWIECWSHLPPFVFQQIIEGEKLAETLQACQPFQIYQFPCSLDFGFI